MKYIDEFRDPVKARSLVHEIQRLADQVASQHNRPLQLMEFCGGHTHTLFKYGIEGMLPASIEMVHGPGCPVCVLPMARVDECVEIAEQPGVVRSVFMTSSSRSRCRIIVPVARSASV